MKKLSIHLTSIIASLILFASVPLLYAWTSPTATPPGANVPSPITIGLASQNKLGALGLGGLAVFGKSLFTEVPGYELPTAKPSMLLGVNGAIGAREYCDENGNNCVTTLGGSNTTSVSSSPSGQILPGWPNKIKCVTGENEAYLDIYYKGYPSTGKVSYLATANTGNQIMISFNYNDGSYSSIAGQGTLGSNMSSAMSACVNKNISQIPGI